MQQEEKILQEKAARLQSGGDKLPPHGSAASQQAFSDEKEQEMSHCGEGAAESGGWMASVYFKVGATVFFTLVACILVFFLIYRHKGLASVCGSFLRSGESIIIGLVLAYLLNPVMKFCEGKCSNLLRGRVKSEEKLKKTSRGVGVICAILFLIAVIGLLIAAIVPGVISSVMSLVDTLPGNIQSFLRWVQSIDFGNEEMTERLSKLITSATRDFGDWATKKLLPEAQTYITQISSGVYSFVRSLLNFVIGIIVAIYVMSIQETLIGQSKKILYAVFKPKHCNIIIEVAREAHRIFGGFITGKLLDSAIIGCICYIGCLILNIPDTLLVAVIIGMTNVIPFFGPIIGAIPCIFLVIVQSPIHALYLLIFVIVLQQVDGNIIGPKILGDSTGLSSFWVMFAILIGGGNFGFLGMLLGVPVMGVIYYLVRRLTNYGVRRRNLPEDTEQYITMHSVDVDTNEMIFEEPEAAAEAKEAAARRKKPNVIQKMIKILSSEEKQNPSK